MLYTVAFDLHVHVPARRKADDWRYTFTNIRGTKNVRITKVQFGPNPQVVAFFHTDDWVVRDHGLIYNNPTFIREFRKAIADKFGVPIRAQDIQYSEQGMQGSSYIHMDITPRLDVLRRPLNVLEMKRMQESVKWSDACDNGLRTAVDGLLICAKDANARLRNGDMSGILAFYKKLHRVKTLVKRTLTCMKAEDPHYATLRKVYDVISAHTDII